MAAMGARSAGKFRRDENAQDQGLGTDQLSGGERQRVAVARSLANRPALVLADESTGNLASQSDHEIIALMRRLNDELGTTFIVVTHDLAVARQTDRVLVMHDGRIVREHQTSNPYQEDLKAFRDSAAGQALLTGGGQELTFLDPAERDMLQRVLRGLE